MSTHEATVERPSPGVIYPDFAQKVGQVQVPRSGPAMEQPAYVYEASDGTTHTAETAEQAIKVCPYLSRIAMESPDKANTILEMSREAEEFMKEFQNSNVSVERTQTDALVEAPKKAPENQKIESKPQDINEIKHLEIHNDTNQIQVIHPPTIEQTTRALQTPRPELREVKSPYIQKQSKVKKQKYDEKAKPTSKVKNVISKKVIDVTKPNSENIEIKQESKKPNTAVKSFKKSKPVTRSTKLKQPSPRPLVIQITYRKSVKKTEKPKKLVSEINIYKNVFEDKSIVAKDLKIPKHNELDERVDKADAEENISKVSLIAEQVINGDYNEEIAEAQNVQTDEISEDRLPIFVPTVEITDTDTPPDETKSTNTKQVIRILEKRKETTGEKATDKLEVFATKEADISVQDAVADVILALEERAESNTAQTPLPLEKIEFMREIVSEITEIHETLAEISTEGRIQSSELLHSKLEEFLEILGYEEPKQVLAQLLESGRLEIVLEMIIYLEKFLTNPETSSRLTTNPVNDSQYKTKISSKILSQFILKKLLLSTAA